MLNQAPALDRVFHALADPARRDMLHRLGAGPLSVSDLARPLPMSLPAALQHVQVLEAAGLLCSSKVGRVRRCALEPAALTQAERWFADQRRLWEGRLDRLGAYLTKLEGDGDGEG